MDDRRKKIFKKIKALLDSTGDSCIDREIEELKAEFYDNENV